MATAILREQTISVSELKRSPKKAVLSAGGKAVAVLNHNKPQFYCVPNELFEAMYEALEDIELAKIVEQRVAEKGVKVTLDDL